MRTNRQTDKQTYTQDDRNTSSACRTSYVKFGDASLFGFFQISCGKSDKQAQRPVKTVAQQATAVLQLVQWVNIDKTLKTDVRRTGLIDTDDCF